MKNNFLKICLMMVTGLSALEISGQEYVSPTKAVEPGKAPKMKVKLLNTNGKSITYVIVFSKGDEVVSGLTDFAKQYKVTSAHYTAIGDAVSAKAGWYDYKRKEFKVIPIDTAEVTSFIGDIAMYNGKPVAHTHFSAATSDGIVHGGHLLELIIGPTLELIVTTEPGTLYKKLDPEFNAAFIDPAQK
ncbi:DNA-binding protein [Pedobacter jeongneungensis]|uniref:DNA-binding protein n=1 Tax=Pedobacter jeongneungensis TaxID=947309 RepID=A0ABP8BGM6_9SPHI